jgi:hypothetical protein
MKRFSSTRPTSPPPAITSKVCTFLYSTTKRWRKSKERHCLPLPACRRAASVCRNFQHQAQVNVQRLVACPKENFALFNSRGLWWHLEPIWMKWRGLKSLSSRLSRSWFSYHRASSQITILMKPLPHRTEVF